VAARQVTLPPVDTYRLISDGLEDPLRYGIRRAFKYAGTPPSDEEIDRIVAAQHDALMLWFCDTFRFPDP